MRRLLCCLLLLLLCTSCAFAEGAEDNRFTPPALLPVWQEEAGVRIYAQWVNEQAYLFLPASAGALKLACSDGWAVQSAEDESAAVLTSSAGEAVTLRVMRSANLRSLYLTSDDPQTQGRAYIDNTGSHETKATGRLTLLGADGSTDYEGGLSQIRGRGHTTWLWGYKKPYQIKLEKKAALLQNDDAPAKTWLLIADAFDATLLHNTIAYDMARALGLQGPDFEPVDLYYDGEYRGTYLLCEKIEIGDGRLEMTDYGKAVEKQNPGSDSAPTATAKNAYGNAFQYVEGVQGGAGDAGSFLIEMNRFFYEGEASWFATSSGCFVEVTSPQYAGKDDVAYISELMQRIENAVNNGGVEPESGRALDELLDLDSVARFWLLSEYTKNPDYWYGSTYFYKPENTDRLYCGPVWDFDISCGIRENESGAEGWLRNDSWLPALTRLPAFQEKVKEIWQTELHSLIQKVLLGAEDAQSGNLHSLIWYASRVAASRAMNFTLWPMGGSYNNINRRTLYETYEENYAFLLDFLQDRVEWMQSDLAGWPGETIESAAFTLAYRNANIPQCASLTPDCTHGNTKVQSLVWDSAPDADEPWNKLYTLTATVTAQNGSRFADAPRITVNGYEPELLEADAQHIVLRYRFAGPFYEEAIYDDVDYGLIYNYAYFVENNPEVVEECGSDDPEDLLAYFADYCLDDQVQGIETYDSYAFIANYDKLLESYYMCEPYSCAIHYLENCYADDLLGMEEEAHPAPLPAEKDPSALSSAE